MRAVVQRVIDASVTIDNKCVSQIGKGALVLVGIKADDTDQDIEYIIKKISGLRIFEDLEGKMNLSIADIAGELLIVPNFTLYGNATKGMRPSFVASGSVDEAKNKYEKFIECLREKDISFKAGVFQADMKVALVNDGPITILLDSSKLF
ncbi:MAG: D-aminoacyl-tRNA deacylase [Cellulosilyticaceae bacterium]